MACTELGSAWNNKCLYLPAASGPRDCLTYSKVLCIAHPRIQPLPKQPQIGCKKSYSPIFFCRPNRRHSLLRMKLRRFWTCGHRQKRSHIANFLFNPQIGYKKSYSPRGYTRDFTVYHAFFRELTCRSAKVRVQWPAENETSGSDRQRIFLAKRDALCYFMTQFTPRGEERRLKENEGITQIMNTSPSLCLTDWCQFLRPIMQ